VIPFYSVMSGWVTVAHGTLEKRQDGQCGAADVACVWKRSVISRRCRQVVGAHSLREFYLLDPMNLNSCVWDTPK
jgi:hypothetical protein